MRLIKMAVRNWNLMDSETKAQAFVREASVEHDTITLAEKVGDDENRLSKLETQTRILSDAVIAIAHVDEAVAPAVRAVQHEKYGATRVHPDRPHRKP